MSMTEKQCLFFPELLPQSSSSWSILQRHCYSLEYVSLGSSSRPDEVHSQNFHNWSPGQVKRLRQGVACSSSRKKKAKVSCCWRPTSTANCCGASVRTSSKSGLAKTYNHNYLFIIIVRAVPSNDLQHHVVSWATT